MILAPSSLIPPTNGGVFAESWGTFLLVMLAAGGAVVAAASGEAVTPGMGGGRARANGDGNHLLYGRGERAHLNLAVTLAFAVRRNFPWRRVPGYVQAQVVGGPLGGTG